MKHYTPFGFYREFLNEEIYKELDKFYFYNNPVDILDYYTDENGKTIASGRILDRDTENHIISFTNNGKEQSISLESSIKDLLSKEIRKTIAYIELGYENRYSKPDEVKSFTFFLSDSLNLITKTKAYNEFSFLKKYFDEIQNIISTYSPNNLKDTSEVNYTNYNVYSFNLIAENQKSTLKNLFEELTKEPRIINCSKEEFYNAFTGREVKNGINWMVVSKNKSTSKVSLIYFIDKLIDNKFLDRKIISDLNKFIKYIFRDKDGKEFQNIKQSKSTFSKNPTSRKRIDEIISSL